MSSSKVQNIKIINIVKKIFVTGGAQVLIQISGFFVGILIIRRLTVNEYAYYTIANTMLGSMTLLADSGISTGVLSRIGKHWKDKGIVNNVFNSGLELRRTFAIISLVVTIPLLILLLKKQNANFITITCIIISIIPAFLAALTDSIYEIVPKIYNDTKQLQLNQIKVSIGRLIMTGILVLILPYSSVALIGNGIPRIIGNLNLRKLVKKHISFDKSIIKNEEKKYILSIVRKMLPEIIYFCLSTQIHVWIITAFGNSKTLAGIGALSRIGTIFNLFTSMFTILITPAFSKLENDKIKLTELIIKVLGGIILLSLIICGITYIFSENILSILGDKYMDLENELVLSVLSSCIYFAIICFYSLNNSRGWVIPPLLYIFISLATMIVAAFLSNLNTLSGVITFLILGMVGQLVTLIIYSFERAIKIH